MFHFELSRHIIQNWLKAASQKSESLTSASELRQEVHFGAGPGLSRIWTGGGKIWGRKLQLFTVLGGWEGQSERSSNWETWLSYFLNCLLLAHSILPPEPWGGSPLCASSLPLGYLWHSWYRCCPPPVSPFLIISQVPGLWRPPGCSQPLHL